MQGAGLPPSLCRATTAALPDPAPACLPSPAGVLVTDGSPVVGQSIHDAGEALWLQFQDRLPARLPTTPILHPAHHRWPAARCPPHPAPPTPSAYGRPALAGRTVCDVCAAWRHNHPRGRPRVHPRRRRHPVPVGCAPSALQGLYVALHTSQSACWRQGHASPRAALPCPAPAAAHPARRCEADTRALLPAGPPAGIPDGTDKLARLGLVPFSDALEEVAMELPAFGGARSIAGARAAGPETRAALGVGVGDLRSCLPSAAVQQPAAPAARCPCARWWPLPSCSAPHLAFEAQAHRCWQRWGAAQGRQGSSRRRVPSGAGGGSDQKG